MPGSDYEINPMSTAPSSISQSNSPNRYTPNASQNSNDFDVLGPQSLHQVPFFDRKPMAWSGNRVAARKPRSPYDDIRWDEKRDSESPMLSGNRYGPEDGSEFQWPPQHAHAYRDRRYSRPLLNYVRNEWRHDLYDDSSPSSPTFSDEEFPSWRQILSAPRYRRYAIEFLAIMSILTFVWGSWIGWIKPARLENKALNEALNETMGKGQMLFGHNMTPAFLGTVQLQTLDKSLVPHKGNGRRLVIVGDVHGCHDELAHLLSKLSFNEHTDHLIFTGDLVSRGPSSAAVLDLAISLNASCVRGNHEDRILLAHRDTVSHPLTLPGLGHEAIPPLAGPNGSDQQGKPSEQASLATTSATDDLTLARTLTPPQITYLTSCPLILHLARLPYLGPTHVVHGGLVPGVPLEHQDPVAVMNMRTIDSKTHVPSRRERGIPWAKLWDRWQSLLPKEERATVIYGHDSHRGLQLGKYSNGLDSNCVRGGKLTALVVEEGKKGKGLGTVGVRCNNYLSKSKKKHG